MGGSFAGRGNCTSVNEFNFILDPHAVEVVLKKLANKITIMPWETTFHTFQEYNDDSF